MLPLWRCHYAIKGFMLNILTQTAVTGVNMPLPLLWIGAGLAGLVGAALTAEHYKDKAQQQTDKDELRRGQLDVADSHVEGEDGVIKWPSEVLTSDICAVPVPGAIVSCSVFKAFDHIGVWIEDDLIVELHGKGLVKAVSVRRFLENRSGDQLFVACDSVGQPLIVPETVRRAVAQVYNYWEYDVIDNNCYRFVWSCIEEIDGKVASFSEFNHLLAKYHNKKVYWDKFDADQ
jgi:hypothetical protein